MRTLTIDAASLSSATGFYHALSGFNVQLEDHDGHYLLRISLHGDFEIIEVLRALERHLEARLAAT